MKIHQLSLFIENKPGQLMEPCRVLAEGGIDIRTLTLADTEKFGILRLIVSDWREGARVLQKAGYVVNVTEVVAVEVLDRAVAWWHCSGYSTTRIPTFSTCTRSPSAEEKRQF